MTERNALARLMAELTQCLDQTDATGDVPERLARFADALPADDPAAAAIGAFAEALGQRLAGQGVQHRFALQRTQHALQHLRQSHPPARAEDRLTGPARATGLLLARALTALPDDRRAAFFNKGAYLQANPDVAAAGVDPLEHYLAGGASEGRLPPGLPPLFPDCFGSASGLPPAQLATLWPRSQPCFVQDCPDSLRAEALERAGAAQIPISVIVPSWNRAHVLGHAVGSALLQSVPPAEVIVIDDGSTDGTADMLRARFADALADGWLVLIEQDNAGVSAARNAGLARARGDIIAYLDSDNLWDPDHLVFLTAAFLDHPQASCAYAAVARHNLDAGWSDLLFRPWDRAALEAENFLDLNGFAHRRQAYADHGGFDTGLTRLVDWDLALRYTAQGREPVAVPLITAHTALDAGGLGNLTLSQEVAANQTRIRQKWS